MGVDENKNKVEETAVLYGASKSSIISDFSFLDLDKLYAYADYLNWQFKDRVELIKGRIFKMAPAPSSLHQEISTNLTVSFGKFFEDKTCKVFSAPFDVRFPNNSNDKNPYTVLQPDLCIVCDPDKLDMRGCNGAPELIVEILSPSSASKDTGLKFDLYEEHKVKEYWIVDAFNRIIDVFILDKKGKFQLLQKFNLDNTIKVRSFPGLEIDLKRIF